MTFQQFVAKWNGKKADWDGAYGGQCVDLFRFYNKEVLDISQPKSVVGAKDFWINYETEPNLYNNFTKIPNSADFTPIEGDVMVWNKNAGNGFGHISMCTGENTGTQYFHSFDQNWSRVSYCEIVNHSYKNVYGVLRPKGETMPTDLKVCLAQHKQLVDEANKKDREIAKLNEEIDNLNREINEHECPTTPIDETEWVANGKTIKTLENGQQEVTINYERKI